MKMFFKVMTIVSILMAFTKDVWSEECLRLFTDIKCENDKPLNLTAEFTELSKTLSPEEKHFSELLIHSRYLRELKANQFEDIVFDSITITGAIDDSESHFTHVDKNAFAITDQVTKRIRIRDMTYLTEPGSFFEALRSVKNLDDLELQGNFSEIPDNAFGNLTKLLWVNLDGLYLKKLGSNAFRHLQSLTKLTIEGTFGVHFPDNAFAIEAPTDINFHLELGTGDSSTSSPRFDQFSPGAFDNLHRPTFLGLVNHYSRSSFDYDLILMEKPFKTFLDANVKNRIILTGRDLDCNDPGNQWIKPAYENRVTEFTCIK